MTKEQIEKFVRITMANDCEHFTAHDGSFPGYETPGHFCALRLPAGEYDLALSGKSPCLIQKEFTTHCPRYVAMSEKRKQWFIGEFMKSHLTQPEDKR